MVTQPIPVAAVRAWRVVLAETSALLRHSLAELLTRQPDFVVIGHAATAVQTVEEVNTHSPDLVLLDPSIDDTGGLDTLRRILGARPRTHVVMLSGHASTGLCIDAIRLGAGGFLLKDLHPADLFEQLRSVRAGQTPVAPSLVGALVAALRDPGAVTAGPEPTEPVDRAEEKLSARELQIMQLVARGLSNREIGRQLCITEGTVKNHVHHALAKLHMDNRIQAAAYIVRQGLGTRA